MPRSLTPDCRTDLIILVNKAELHRIRRVIYQDHIVKIAAHKIHQVLLGLGKLQIMLACFKIIIAVYSIIIRSFCHISRHIVVSLARNTGKDNYRCV